MADKGEWERFVRRAIDATRHLTDAEKRLLHLYRAMGRKGTFMKPRTLVERLGWSEASLKRHRSHLVACGLVEPRKLTDRHDLRNQRCWHVVLPPALVHAQSLEEARAGLDDFIRAVERPKAKVSTVSRLKGLKVTPLMEGAGGAKVSTVTPTKVSTLIPTNVSTVSSLYES